MAIQFCNVCGDLLPISSGSVIKCDCCAEMNTNESLDKVTISSTDKFPSQLRQKREVFRVPAKIASTDTWSTIDVQCRKCGADEVRYTSLQLRSADEGSTMFYFCSACSERWNEDN